MISQSIIGSLSDNQICFLIHVLNRGADEELYGFDSIKSIRIQELRKPLQEYKAKVNEEYLQEYLELCKIFGA